MSGKYLVTSELAASLRCSEKTIARLVQQKKIPVIRFGRGRMLFDREVIEQLLRDAQQASVSSDHMAETAAG
jgi:excisionase family DNA binding protein